MPTDLRDLYASLADDADTTALAPATSVRRRGDRHTRTVAVAACVGAALAVGGVAIAANSIGRTPAPADSPSPVESPSPAGSPSSSPTGSPVSPAPSTQASVPPANAPIPDKAFFTPPANRTREKPGKPYNGRANVPSMCNAKFPSNAEIGRQRGRSVIFDEVNANPDAIPLGEVAQTISVYQPGGGAAAMADFRAAVAACPSEKLDTGATLTYQLVTAKALGDDAILIEETWRMTTPPDTPPYPSPSKSLISIVRVGDVVTILYVTGWEGIDADPGVTRSYTDLAVRAIERWRG